MDHTSDEMVKLAYFLRMYKLAGGNIDDLGNISGVGAARVVEAVSFSKLVVPPEDMPTIEKVFSLQTSNILQRVYGNVSLQELTQVSERELQTINNLGPKRLREVKDVLREFGLELAKTTR